jgi:hypothetical protein
VLQRDARRVAVVARRLEASRRELLDGRRRARRDGAGGDERVGDAGVEPARAEGGEEVRGLADQADAPVGVGQR